MESYETAAMLARFWGALGLIMALIYLIKPNTLKNVIKEFDHESGASIDAGYLTIILGIGSLALYGKWSFDWRVWVTVFGWLALIKGVRILAFPEFLSDLQKDGKLQKMLKPILFGYAILSGYLFLKGMSQ